jgi:hypothetical protein
MNKIRAVNSRQSLLENKGLLAILVTIFYLLVRLLYTQEIAPANSFSVVNTSSFLSVDILTVIFFSLLPLFFLPKYIDIPSSMISWMLYCFSYLPTAFFSIYYADSIISYCQLMLLLTLGLSVFRFSTLIRIHLAKWKKVDFLNLDYFSMFFLTSFIVYYTWSLSGFSIDLNFNNVYVRRLDAREVDLGILAYLMVFIKTAFLVLAVYLWVTRRKSLYFIVSLFGVMAIFAFDGTKGTLISAMILIAYSFFASYFSREAKRPSTILIVFIALCTISLIEWNFLKSSVLSEYLVRRIFVMPGIINSYYFDYFDAFPELVHVADQVSYTIGQEYFGNAATNANSGIWMDAYAKAGLIGVTLVSFFSGCIAIVLDAMIEKDKRFLGMLIGLMVGITWSEQALTTSILSGGILFYILLLFWFKISLRLNKYSTKYKF